MFVSERDDKRSRRERFKEVNAVVPPVPQYLNWSQEPITWDRRDHPELMPNPGGYALVLEPMIISTKRACTFSRVLIDSAAASTSSTATRWRSWASPSPA